MPIYVHYCQKCQVDWEIQRPISEYDKPYPCPDCENITERLPTKAGFSLKGGGWYRDGYTKPGKDE
jgi:putative FmdB family regulatory protein